MPLLGIFVRYSYTFHRDILRIWINETISSLACIDMYLVSDGLLVRQLGIQTQGLAAKQIIQPTKKFVHIQDYLINKFSFNCMTCSLCQMCKQVIMSEYKTVIKLITMLTYW